MYPGSSGTINGVFMEVPANSEPKVFDLTIDHIFYATLVPRSRETGV